MTAKDVPLGYQLLQTGERLRKYIYHMCDDVATAVYPARLGLGFDLGKKEIYFLSSENVKLFFINLIITWKHFCKE